MLETFIWIINCGIIPFVIAFIIYCVTEEKEDFLFPSWFFSLIIMFFITWNIHSIISELILITILIAILLLPYLCIRLYKRKHETTSRQCPICDETFTYKFRIEDKQICDSCYENVKI